jgi:hypothetical protein
VFPYGLPQADNWTQNQEKNCAYHQTDIIERSSYDVEYVEQNVTNMEQKYHEKASSKNTIELCKVQKEVVAVVALLFVFVSSFKATG